MAVAHDKIAARRNLAVVGQPNLARLPGRVAQEPAADVDLELAGVVELNRALQGWVELQLVDDNRDRLGPAGRAANAQAAPPRCAVGGRAQHGAVDQRVALAVGVERPRLLVGISHLERAATPGIHNLDGVTAVAQLAVVGAKGVEAVAARKGAGVLRQYNRLVGPYDTVGREGEVNAARHAQPTERHGAIGLVGQLNEFELVAGCVAPRQRVVHHFGEQKVLHHRRGRGGGRKLQRVGPVAPAPRVVHHAHACAISPPWLDNACGRRHRILVDGLHAAFPSRIDLIEARAAARRHVGNAPLHRGKGACTLGIAERAGGEANLIGSEAARVCNRGRGRDGSVGK